VVQTTFVPERIPSSNTSHQCPGFLENLAQVERHPELSEEALETARDAQHRQQILGRCQLPERRVADRHALYRRVRPPCTVVERALGKERRQHEPQVLAEQRRIDLARRWCFVLPILNSLDRLAPQVAKRAT